MTRPLDTSPGAWAVYLERLRAMPPSERLRLACEWSDAVREIAKAGARARRSA